MAKKVEEIKAEMGFSKVAPMCSSCKHFTFQKVMVRKWNNQEYPVDKKLRCGLGGFKVGKSNWCQRYEKKAQTGE